MAAAKYHDRVQFRVPRPTSYVLKSDVLYIYTPLSHEQVTRTGADGTTKGIPQIIVAASQPPRPTVTCPKCPCFIVNNQDHEVHVKTAY